MAKRPGPAAANDALADAPQPDGLPSRAVILFAQPDHAEWLVAGVPAAARVLRAASQAGLAHCTVLAGDGWVPGPFVQAEAARLAGEMTFTLGGSVGGGSPGADPMFCLAGDTLPDADTIRATRRSGPAADLAATGATVQAGAATAAARLSAASRATLRATAKPGDGIVSHWLNRPVSQAISALLLRWPAVRPIHATWGTALIAMAMFAVLLAGGPWSMAAGGLLFHAASVFDGVDGEISRATFRTSPKGAMLDSVVDALTNLGFILGLSINRALAGDVIGSRAGFFGMACLALGLFLIGRIAARSKAPFGFELVKEHYRARSAQRNAARSGAETVSKGATLSSALMRFLTFVTSRDFFALVFALVLLAGFARQILVAFALFAGGWLVAVGVALWQRGTVR